jgi:RND family efflux transporter MFP subunit
MDHATSSKLKALWIVPPLLIGIVFLSVMKSGKKPPTESELGEPVRTVRTMEIEKSDFVPVAQGYGEVQPDQVWKSLAQVAGRIIEIHPRLDNGEIIKKGDTLLKIDPVDYELSLLQADIQLTELGVQKANSTASLKIEQRNLKLAEKEHRRLRNLAEKGTVSQSSADAAERNMLGSSTLVQNMKNTLTLLPTQMKLQQAIITQLQRDLANTQITAPFNLRVSGLEVELDQYVSKGQHMFSGDSIERVEIVTQVSMTSLRNLFLGDADMLVNLDSVTNNLSGLTGFTPTLSLDIGGDQLATWDATFVRFSDAVDSETRTMGVIVAVDHPLDLVIPGIRPPLSKGLFLEVFIAGRTLPDQIVIPRSAIRNGRAYVVDRNSRLEIRTITKRFDQDDYSIVDGGLQEGDQLVLTDLIPAVAGMLLDPVVEKATLNGLSAGE